MNLLRMNALMIANRESTARFSMHNWTWAGIPDYDCNTPACLMGNYAAREDLQDHFVIRGGDLALRSRPTIALWEHREVLDQLQRHFDLTADEVVGLFDRNGCGGAGTDRAAALAYVETLIARKLSERPPPDEEPDEDEPEEEPDEEEIIA